MSEQRGAVWFLTLSPRVSVPTKIDHSEPILEYLYIQMCIKGNLRRRRNKKYYQATHPVTTNVIQTHYLPLKPVLALVFSNTDAPSSTDLPIPELVLALVRFPHGPPTHPI